MMTVFNDNPKWDELANTGLTFKLWLKSFVVPFNVSFAKKILAKTPIGDINLCDCDSFLFDKSVHSIKGWP